MLNVLHWSHYFTFKYCFKKICTARQKSPRLIDSDQLQYHSDILDFNTWKCEMHPLRHSEALSSLLTRVMLEQFVDLLTNQSTKNQSATISIIYFYTNSSFHLFKAKLQIIHWLHNVRICCISLFNVTVKWTSLDFFLDCWSDKTTFENIILSPYKLKFVTH